MGMSYTHLLIPTQPEIVPTSEGIVEFMAGVIELGVVPSGRLTFLPVDRVESRTIRGRNPFTGESLEFRTPTRRTAKGKALKKPQDIVAVAKAVAEFDVRLSGEGIPRTPPVSIDFSKPYSI